MGESNTAIGMSVSADEITLTKSATNVLSIKDRIQEITTGTSNITTTSTTYVDMTDMTDTNTFQTSSKVLILFDIPIDIQTSNQNCFIKGLETANSLGEVIFYFSTSTTPAQKTSHFSLISLKELSGAKTIKLQWKTNTGTAYQNGATTNRRMIIIEFTQG